MKRYALTKRQREAVRKSLLDLKAGRALRLSDTPTIKKILEAARKTRLLRS
jgi:hypothetical protein